MGNALVFTDLRHTQPCIPGTNPGVAGLLWYNIVNCHGIRVYIPPPISKMDSESKALVLILSNSTHSFYNGFSDSLAGAGQKRKQDTVSLTQ